MSRGCQGEEKSPAAYPGRLQCSKVQAHREGESLTVLSHQANADATSSSTLAPDGPTVQLPDTREARGAHGVTTGELRLAVVSAG